MGKTNWTLTEEVPDGKREVWDAWGPVHQGDQLVKAIGPLLNTALDMMLAKGGGWTITDIKEVLETMGEIYQLKTGSDYQSALDMAEQLKPGKEEITHGIAMYRTKDGRVCYRLFADSADNLTYMFGLLERIKMWLFKEALEG